VHAPLGARKAASADVYAWPFYADRRTGRHGVEPTTRRARRATIRGALLREEVQGDLQRSGEMSVQSIVEFRTPVVREMTHAEYREQRQRVVASVLLDSRADGVTDRRSPYGGVTA
jgi:hypothetical protein